uniref:PH domain-containing protein n=1 Tax=Caenorhabditis japonica TaxID=281687 RepID=A0A8R1HI82_CAEJA
MHYLLSCLLHQRQLNVSAQLFNVSHYDIITDLSNTFPILKEFINAPTYPANKVEQSVVEIAIARLTAAIRETGSIESYAAELVDLLDEVIRHPMTSLDERSRDVDSPHCKIASDLLSSLFLHYGNKSVMTLTIPVALKCLQSENGELVKNTTSYISLAAIHNGKSLASQAFQIISNVMRGNYSLIRVLPHIYPENKEPFHAQLAQLIDLIQNQDVDTSEKLSLLQLAAMVANTKPEVLIPYLPRFDVYLLSPQMSTALLNIYMSLISQHRTKSLAQFLPTLKLAAQSNEYINNRTTICKIIANIGRVSSSLASEAVDELILMARHNLDDAHLLQTIFNEIEAIGSLYSGSLCRHMSFFQTLPPSRTIERILAHVNSENTGAPQGDYRLKERSSESLMSKSSKHFGNVISSGGRTVFEVCESPTVELCELDRNTHSLAMQYQNNRSSGSLSRRSHASIAHSLGAGTHGNYSDYNESREMSSLISVPSSSRSNMLPPSTRVQTLPQSFAPAMTQIQMGKDGRVRPVGGGRRPVQWPAGSTETTFPAHLGPITTSKMCALNEEDEKWINNDRNDVVYKFVEHRKNKIRRYIGEVNSRFPVPVQCTVEGSKTSKHRMVVHFSCQTRSSPCCVFTKEYLFAIKTKYPAFWLHFMFLQMECSAITQFGEVVGKDSQQYQTLEHCWKCLPTSITKNVQFDTMITAAFPNSKDQDKLVKELDEAGFFACFTMDVASNMWNCISCTNPDKVRYFVEEGGAEKVLEGHLKEKKGRWRFLKRWNTKYFTLSSAALNYSTQHMPTDSRALLPSIDLRSIRSVRSLGRGKKSRKSLRKAFEIFTSDNTSLILKAKDEKNAEEWLQCLQIAMAHARRELTS